MSKGKIIGIIVLLAVGLGILGIVGRGCALGARMADNAAETAFKEFSPEAMLRKYEWFKDAAATLAAKKASIEVYKNKQRDMVEMYGDTPRKDWDRVDKQTYSQWGAEVAGVIASYNGLASEYNSQSRSHISMLLH